MMGTRSGSVDPGILIHLLRSHPCDHATTSNDEAEPLDETLNHKSGLLGISGLSSDMRDIVAAKNAGNDRAQLAFDIFIHRLQKEIAGMAASLGGVDAVVFTAGIGENSPEVRSAACEQLGFLHLRLDPEKNAAVTGDMEISAPESRIRVLVIRAQEDWAIARECARMISQS
jgi:acetate kinase